MTTLVQVKFGTVKWFDPERLFGFIIIDGDGVEIWFHFNDGQIVISIGGVPVFVKVTQTTEYDCFRVVPQFVTTTDREVIREGTVSLAELNGFDGQKLGIVVDSKDRESPDLVNLALAVKESSG